MASPGPVNGFSHSTSKARQFKDFDVFVKAGGPHRAYVETVPVQVADGKFDISFTPNLENPEINGIEILPEP
jgi:alcohol dehydrogenase (cytochrome c)